LTFSFSYSQSDIMNIHFLLRAKFLALAFLGSLTLIGHSAGHAAGDRFVPNAAGDEITDTETGLIWRRCAEGQLWSGTTCTDTPTSFSFRNALEHAKSVATSTGVAWRLPNVKELSSLVIRNKSAALINTTAFPSSGAQVIFWSSTPQHSSAMVGGWFVDFQRGYVGMNPSTVTYAVRLVRDAN
jgi:hypothetical protein